MARSRVSLLSTSATSLQGSAAADTTVSKGRSEAALARISRAQMIRDTIVPNEVEASLFETLLAAAKHAGRHDVLHGS